MAMLLLQKVWNNMDKKSKYVLHLFDRYFINTTVNSAGKWFATLLWYYENNKMQPESRFIVEAMLAMGED
mgnify:CR=1 FL=1